MSDRKNGGGGGGAGGGGNGFKPLGLSDEVYKGIVRMGFRMPTPVQRKALPVVLSGVDSCVMARTGSGKTVAFLIPLLERLLAQEQQPQYASQQSNSNSSRALILSPTRELSMQTLRVLTKISHFAPHIKAIGIHGGEGMEHQFDLLASKPDVIVATPGRLSHHLTEIPDFSLRNCTICILDEADRLMEMGFAMQLRQIARALPGGGPSGDGSASMTCQKVLLSATMPKSLVEFTKSGCFCSPDPHVVRLDSESTVSEDLRIAFITCRSLEKDAALLHILSHIEQDRRDAKEATRTGRTLVFCATRHHVEYVASFIRASKGDGENSATLLYGTLDPAARNSNLASFRNGTTPILITTDVAARGIDVPMIDHVIHYHFPPNAKLFVHRSGRAARAGRIGFCWGLVDPEELPYMVELHLFLGRRLSTAWKEHETIEGEGAKQKEEDGSSKKKKGEWLTYTLSEMTPEMVHYGGVPESILTYEIESVRRIMESEMTGSGEAETMRALSKVCNNAMKQYRRTRPEASREGVRRAKAILEGERMETGQRVLKSDLVGGGGGGGSIPPHPLLRGMELKRYHDAKKRKKDGDEANNVVTNDRPALDDLDNLLKREEFLRAMSNFRPKETVFEAFATGGGKKKDSGVVSHVDKGRTTSTKAQSDSIALKAMRSMRRQMRMAHDKGTALVVAGSETAMARNNDEGAGGDGDGHPISAEHDDEMGDEEEEEGVERQVITSKVTVPPQLQPKQHIDKRRMSRAERKRLKKNHNAPSSSSDSGGYHTNTQSHNSNKPKKTMRGADFRDPAFFIENDITSNTEEAQRSRHVEAAMQPSTSSATMKGAAVRIEEAMLDLVGDEREDLVQRQRMMRWDKAKRKYVQTTVGSELSGESRSKKLRTESGQLVNRDKMKLGELYEKWQKKTNRSVGRDGVFDDPTNDDGIDAAPTMDRRGGGRGGGKKGGSSTDKNKGDKPKSAAEIKMERAQKQDNKLKNMKKGDRQRLEQSQRQNQGKGGAEAKKGYQGKKGASGRWAGGAGKGKGRK